MSETKLTTKDEWTYLTYYLDGEKLDEKYGGEALVEWPDGTERWERFESNERRTTYGDMGNTRHGRCFDWVVTVDHNGMGVTKPLTSLTVLDIRQHSGDSDE